jgi:hypothetical protein
MSDTTQVIVQEVTKASPAIAVQGVQLFGMQINDVVQICTLVYLGLQGAYLLWKWIREACKDE